MLLAARVVETAVRVIEVIAEVLRHKPTLAFTALAGSLLRVITVLKVVVFV